MSETSRTRIDGFRTFVTMLALIAVPVGITLLTVKHPNQSVATSANPTPLGYTWSLLIFVIPVAVLTWHFFVDWAGRMDRRAFYVAVVAFAFSGIGLDITLGNTFFRFPNKEATLGIMLPGWVFGTGWVSSIPIEELVFYISGNLFTLLAYLWGTHVWFVRYNRHDYLELPKDTRRMFQPHWTSLIYAVVFIGGALIVKRHLPAPLNQGFPGYFIFQVCVLFCPTFVLFRSVSKWINWRAMSLSIMMMWLLSVIWEATLALPYGWWDFNREQMVGIFVWGWHDLPIEEVVLWTLAPWVTSMVYEAVRLFLHSQNSTRVTLVGSKVDATAAQHPG
jgi:hypothetical protein